MRIVTLLLLFSLSACSVFQEEQDRHLASPKKVSKRVCDDSLKAILEAKKQKFVDAGPLARVLKERANIRSKYHELVESVRDFTNKAHKPIRGKAKLVLDPTEGYLTKIMMIRNAKSTIDISYYIFKDDASSQALLHELRLAIKRGVKVRMMVDSLGSLTSAPFHDNLKSLSSLRGGFVRAADGTITNERAKFEAVIFNPVFNIKSHVINWYRAIANLFKSKKDPYITFSMNRRSHDKILLVDAHSKEDSMAIIGGRNLANYYYGLGEDVSKTYEDLEILVKGIAQGTDPSKMENVLNNYYNKIFYYMANKNLQNFIIGITRSGIRKQFKKMRSGSWSLLRDDPKIAEKLKEMEDNKYLDDGFDEGLISVVNELQNIVRTRAFLNPLGKHNRRNGDSIVAKLKEQMKSAKKQIDIVSPYLWLSEEEIKFFKEWVQEDPERKVRLISNSIITTDNVPAQAMVDTILGPRLVSDIKGEDYAHQIEVYAFGKSDDLSIGGDVAYGKLHGKFSIIDGKKAIVGTSNLDPRSRYLNTELAISYEGKTTDELTTTLSDYMDRLVANSTLWGSDEWNQIRSHKKVKNLVHLQGFVGKIIHFFNLVPLI